MGKVLPRAIAWLGRRRSVRWLATRIQAPVDRWLLGHTGGHVSTVPGMPTLLLHTTGRRSGRARTSPVFYVPADGAVAVVDTNYGREPRPDWSHNLAAEATAAFTLRGERRPARARIARGAERERLWADLVAVYPPYEDYAAALDRTPHVWVLDPD